MRTYLPRVPQINVAKERYAHSERAAHLHLCSRSLVALRQRLSRVDDENLLCKPSSAPAPRGTRSCACSATLFEPPPRLSRASELLPCPSRLHLHSQFCCKNGKLRKDNAECKPGCSALRNNSTEAARDALVEILGGLTRSELERRTFWNFATLHYAAQSGILLRSRAPWCRCGCGAT